MSLRKWPSIKNISVALSFVNWILYTFKDITKPTPVFDTGCQGELFPVHGYKDHPELPALFSSVIVLPVSALNQEIG